jgi:hypothetical protein
MRAGQRAGPLSVTHCNRQFQEPWLSAQPLMSAATSAAPGSFPRRCLVVISHAEDAALTKMSFVSSAIASPFFYKSDGSPLDPQK